MRFTSLHMKDFRATRDLEIGFEPDMTVIVGRNGAGKTSILDALCIMMQFSRLHISGQRQGDAVVRHSDLDVRKQSEGYALALNFYLIEGASCSTRSDVIGIEYNKEKQSLNFQYSAALMDLINAEEFQPRFLYFRQERGFKSQNRWRSKNDFDELHDPVIVQDRSLDIDLQAIEDLEAWWDQRDAQEARRVRDGSRSYRDPQLDAIRELIARIDSFSGIAFDSIALPPGLYFIKNDNTPVHIGSLSSGERSFIVLLADLARRIQVFQPGKPLHEIEAIVLIDEIELNLHPAWQSEIVPMLSEVFASCQFIVTTHSPQVLSGVESRQVRIVEVDSSDGSSKVTAPLSTRGRTSNYLLEGVLGSSERFPPVDALIGEFNAAIDEGDAETAAARLAALEEQIEDDAATLLVLRKRLKKLRGAA